MSTTTIREGRAFSAEASISIDVTVGGKVAVAVASLDDDDLSALGESKRAPGDPWDGNVAADLAVGRALKILGEAMVDRASS